MDRSTCGGARIGRIHQGRTNRDYLTSSSHATTASPFKPTARRRVYSASRRHRPYSPFDPTLNAKFQTPDESTTFGDCGPRAVSEVKHNVCSNEREKILHEKGEKKPCFPTKKRKARAIFPGSLDKSERNDNNVPIHRQTVHPNVELHQQPVTNSQANLIKKKVRSQLASQQVSI